MEPSIESFLNQGDHAAVAAWGEFLVEGKKTLRVPFSFSPLGLCL
jgi:hypothetical protein